MEDKAGVSGVIQWGGITCCLGVAALYCIGRSVGRDVEFLKSVPRVNKLKDLAELLKKSKVLPSVVTVSGRADSSTPIHCKHSGLQGVLVKQKAEYHLLKRNDKGLWDQNSTSPLSTNKEVPWYLDDGTGVSIIGAHGASGLVLTHGNEVFEESGEILRGISDCFQGLKMLGVMRTGKVLTTGTTLTVVGEAVAKDSWGRILIRQPDGGPFYVSHKSIDQLIAYLGKDSRWYKYATIGLAVLGVFILVMHTSVNFRKRMDNLERPKRYYKKYRMTPGLLEICKKQEYKSVSSQLSAPGNIITHISLVSSPMLVEFNPFTSNRIQWLRNKS